MKFVERKAWLNFMIDNLKFWRGRHMGGDATKELDYVIEEFKHYADVEAGICKLDLDRFDFVALGEDVSLEQLADLPIIDDEFPKA